MGFMNWLMKGVGFENEEVYDDSFEKQKLREEKRQKEAERKRQKEEYKAKRARDKADRMAKKFAVKQEKDVAQKPQSTTVSYAENPEQYNTQRTYSSPVNNYGMNMILKDFLTAQVVQFMHLMEILSMLTIISFCSHQKALTLKHLK